MTFSHYGSAFNLVGAAIASCLCGHVLCRMWQTGQAALVYWWYIYSNEHFCRSLVTDKLKSQKTGCSNPHQDPSPIKIQFWWSHVQLYLECCWQADLIFLPNSGLMSALTQDMLTCASQLNEGELCFDWSKQPCIVHSQSTLCYLGAVTEAKVTSWVKTTHLHKVNF